MLYPTTLETEAICAAKEFGALRDIDPNAAAHIKDAGIGVVMCLDPRHSKDKIEHLKVFLDCENIIPIYHLGGPLALDPGLPFVQENHLHHALLWQIEEARKVTHFAGLFLLGHIPCGLARRHGLNPLDVLQSLLRARTSVMKHLSFPLQGEPGMLLHFYDGKAPVPARTRHVWESETKPFLRSYPSVIAVPA